MKWNNLFFVGFFLLVKPLIGQEVLTADAVVEAVLQQGFGIKLAKQQWDALQIDVSRGNAGQLPTVGLVAGGTLQSTNINQEFSNGTVIVRNGVGANTVNAGLNVSWILFNGKRMFITYDRLTMAAAGGELLWKQEVELAIRSVLESYYALVQLNMEIKARKSALMLLEEQLLLAERRFELGSGDKQPVLQAKIGLNDIRTAILTQQQQSDVLKISLNQQMGRAVNLDFQVADSIVQNESLTFAELQGAIDQQNIRMAIQQNRIQQLEKLYQETKADQLPTLQFNAAFGLNRNQSEGGFSLYNFSQGPSAGLILNWNVFDGGRVKRTLAQRKIAIEQSRLEQSMTLLNVQGELYSAWKRFETWKEIQILEEQNLTSAQESFVLAQERFRLGSSGMLEVREAQRSLDEAISKTSRSRVERKLAELALLQVSGRLQLSKR